LGGYPPFFDESRQRLFKKIKSGKFEFHPQYWEGTSDEAKFLISKMLTVDPKKRPSAKQLLSYPWLCASDEALSGKDLTGTLKELKRFNARRQFRGAVDAILAAQRLTNVKM
jgi:calcium/calmodulin-dependent protein kinase I